MNDTGIQWCDATWNPVRGCSRVSAGCTNCYAERVAGRFCGAPVMASNGSGLAAKPGGPFHGFAWRPRRGEARWTGRVELLRDRLSEPLRRRRGRRVFVNSMSDLFHERLPFEDIARVHAVMAMARWHRYLVLTKRPRRALEFYAWLRGEMARAYAPAPPPSGIDFNALVGPNWERLEGCPEIIHAAGRLAGTRDGDFPPTLPLPNVALGVSVEDQKTADDRIPVLLELPAAMRFVSYEPALGPVDFEPWLRLSPSSMAASRRLPVDAPAWTRIGSTRVDCIIVGGESGPRARPFNVQWAHRTIEQCADAGIACFVKQLGTVPVDGDRLRARLTTISRSKNGRPDGALTDDGGLPAELPMIALRDRAGGDPSEWPDDLVVQRMPEGWA